ncbi:MAG TPA: 3-hydroxyacyl-CoA dehydrogenase NAD-binding domain-containing protein [Thermoanaerobaculia bacterium]|nr:3-hydroxyacyl-CoA dehydrogenase NAD-binding domain-containing protein [Thermoanaerobaculia bacterium]
MEQLTYAVDSDGIATITWDMPGRSMNVLNGASLSELAQCVDQALEDEDVRGIVITSGKPAFIAGADLSMLGSAASSGDPKALFESNVAFNLLLRRLETGGKPVAAAINGTALGGGFEICLASHYRVAADDPKAQIGLPEAKVGVMPGGGGTQRLPRLIGAMQALPLMLQGRTLSPTAAQGQGLIHKVVPKEELLEEARRWILEEGDAVQPWDKPGYKIRGGAPYSPQGMPVFMMGNAMLRKESLGKYPAQQAIMQAVYEGLQVPIEAGLRIESRLFTGLLLSPTARNMIRSLFLSMQELDKGARRPQGVPPSETKKLGVLGAGMMGAGIAYVSAGVGIEVVLLDTELENAERGKQHSAELMDKRMLKGRATAAERTALLERIHPTTDYAELAGCDLVIEAVFEDRGIKAGVTNKAEAVIGDDAVFGSNTSTLPITGLAEASVRPESFIGIHFFSPVDRMKLVEIIVGEQTGERALAVAMDYVRKIRKTPIVVNDSRGFYTSRCFGTYVGEGLAMLAEGIPPALIENVGRRTGMPRAPLEMNDDVALDLGWKVRQQTRKDLGDRYVETPADEILEKMVVELERFGRKNKEGFYEYPEDAPKRLWPGLPALVEEVTGRAQQTDPPPPELLEKRLLYIQALEAARCFEEKVVTDVRDADVGAILGWGFAPWSGGPLSLIDTVGAATFVAECEALAERFGERFRPNALLREMAEKGESFYRRFAPGKAA